MATDNVITIVGNLVDDPELRYTPTGTAVADVRVAVNRRFRNRDSGEWEDRLDGYFRCNVWREQAENVANSLNKGARVLVTGRLISRSYEDKEGQTRWVTEIEADEVCPSLRWATAQVTKNDRSQGRRDGQQSDGYAPPPATQPPEPEDVPF